MTWWKKRKRAQEAASALHTAADLLSDYMTDRTAPWWRDREDPGGFKVAGAKVKGKGPDDPTFCIVIVRGVGACEDLEQATEHITKKWGPDAA